MHSTTILLYLGLACSLAAAVPTPLNINLGAYSPALVVGDGAISFGGPEAEAGGPKEPGRGGGKAGEGAAAGAAGEGAAAGAGAGAAGGAGRPPATEGAAVVGAQQNVAAVQDGALLQGMGKQRLPRE